MSERVYILGRGPWLHKYVGFGVSQAAASSPRDVSHERRGAGPKQVNLELMVEVESSLKLHERHVSMA